MTYGNLSTRKTVVFCTLQFEATHNWPGCDISEVLYLQNEHRHMFHIKAYKDVNHDDRDVEFIKLKRDIAFHLRLTYGGTENTAKLGAKSCEMLAHELMTEFGLSQCEVNEDGENGAIVYAQ